MDTLSFWTGGQTKWTLIFDIYRLWDGKKISLIEKKRGEFKFKRSYKQLQANKSIQGIISSLNGSLQRLYLTFNLFLWSTTKHISSDFFLLLCKQWVWRILFFPLFMAFWWSQKEAHYRTHYTVSQSLVVFALAFHMPYYDDCGLIFFHDNFSDPFIYL